MSVRLATLFAAAALLAAAPASAQSLWGRADTLMTASGTRPVFGASDTRSRVPLYQFIQLHTEDLGLDGLSLEVSGLAGMHMGDAPLVTPTEEGDPAMGDLIVGRVRWQSKQGDLAVSLGRQYLFTGTGRAEHLDGLVVTVRGPWNIDATLFGGRTTPWQVEYDPAEGDPSATNEDWAMSNWAVGGRLRLRMLDRVVAMLGFFHERHDDQVMRTNMSLDFGFWGNRWFEALAGGVVDLAQGTPQEVWLQLTSRPLPRLKLLADYTFQVPSLAIPRTSLFSVFVTDSFHDLCLGAHYGVTDTISVGLEGGVRFLPDDEDIRPGGTVRASARWALTQHAHLGLHARLVADNYEQLVQGRIYLMLARSKRGVHGLVEYHVVYLHQDQAERVDLFLRRTWDNPVSHGALSLIGYELRQGLSLQVGYSAFVTPAARSDHRLLARLTLLKGWRFGP